MVAQGSSSGESQPLPWVAVGHWAGRVPRGCRGGRAACPSLGGADCTWTAPCNKARLLLGFSRGLTDSAKPGLAPAPAGMDGTRAVAGGVALPSPSDSFGAGPRGQDGLPGGARPVLEAASALRVWLREQDRATSSTPPRCRWEGGSVRSGSLWAQGLDPRPGHQGAGLHVCEEWPREELAVACQPVGSR